MSHFIRSDLFRNFLGGFAIGAVAMFALQPDQGQAHPPIGNQQIESPASQ